VRDEMVRIPRGVRILDIEPSRIPVRLERVKRSSVPVTLAPVGEPRDGYKVQTAQGRPREGTGLGPREPASTG
jgi:hypothetical protein